MQGQNRFIQPSQDLGGYLTCSGSWLPTQLRNTIKQDGGDTLNLNCDTWSKSRLRQSSNKVLASDLAQLPGTWPKLTTASFSGQIEHPDTIGNASVDKCTSDSPHLVSGSLRRSICCLPDLLSDVLLRQSPCEPHREDPNQKSNSPENIEDVR